VEYLRLIVGWFDEPNPGQKAKDGWSTQNDERRKANLRGEELGIKTRLSQKVRLRHRANGFAIGIVNRITTNLGSQKRVAVTATNR
jgi:hypothetical protein